MPEYVFPVMILIHIFECKLCRSFTCRDSNWYFKKANYAGVLATLSTSWPLLSKCVFCHWSVGWISNGKWARIFICNEQARSVGSNRKLVKLPFQVTRDKILTFLSNNHNKFCPCICKIFENYEKISLISVLMGDMRRDLILTTWRTKHQIS